MAAPPSGQRKALTTVQESRLVLYLDDELYKLSGAFESRHSGTSRLPTLDAFLQALLPLHAFILTIPAVPPSGALRIAYYLNLTSFIAPALDGYTILDETLDTLFETLARFDRGWVAVLRGDDWDSTAGRARSEQTMPTGGYAGGMRTTDRARLESLVKQIRAVLAISLGLPQFVPLENDPFLEMLQQRRDRPDLAGPLPSQFREISAMHDQDEDSASASQASTPSLLSDDTLASDADSAMSVDTVTDNLSVPRDNQGIVITSEADDTGDNDDGDDVDDVEFEEVAVADNGPSLSPRQFERERLPNAIVDPPEPDGSFEIHYEIPPPALHDGEITLENGATPIVGQRRGFDPDAEYPLSEEEGDPIVPRRRGRRSGSAAEDPEDDEEDDEVMEGSEEVDGIDDSTRERLKHVFELTERALTELRSADAQ
ncbi:hypothetical protein JCM3774_000934 [Rhodotorula dairenensis]